MVAKFCYRLFKSVTNSPDSSTCIIKNLLKSSPQQEPNKTYIMNKHIFPDFDTWYKNIGVNTNVSRPDTHTEHFPVYS